MNKKNMRDKIRRKSVEELKDKMGGAYTTFDVQVAYKEGYNKAIDEVSTLCKEQRADAVQEFVEFSWDGSEHDSWIIAKFDEFKEYLKEQNNE